MKVWIAEVGQYESRGVNAVYASLKAAKAAYSIPMKEGCKIPKNHEWDETEDWMGQYFCGCPLASELCVSLIELEVLE